MAFLKSIYGYITDHTYVKWGLLIGLIVLILTVVTFKTNTSQLFLGFLRTTIAQELSEANKQLGYDRDVFKATTEALNAKVVQLEQERLRLLKERGELVNEGAYYREKTEAIRRRPPTKAPENINELSKSFNLLGYPNTVLDCR